VLPTMPLEVSRLRDARKGEQKGIGDVRRLHPAPFEILLCLDDFLPVHREVVGGRGQFGDQRFAPGRDGAVLRLKPTPSTPSRPIARKISKTAENNFIFA
jgi:hypothetical protein